MKLNKPFTFKYIIFRILVFTGALLLLGVNFYDSNSPLKIPTAAADSRLGILGQAAPELNLSTWIDGNGKKIESVRLSDFGGKVVYLYFFQDW